MQRHCQVKMDKFWLKWVRFFTLFQCFILVISLISGGADSSLWHYSQETPRRLKQWICLSFWVVKSYFSVIFHKKVYILFKESVQNTGRLLNEQEIILISNVNYKLKSSFLFPCTYSMFYRAASFFLVQIPIFWVNYKVLLKDLNTRITFQWLRMCGFQVCYDRVLSEEMWIN